MCQRLLTVLRVKSIVLPFKCNQWARILTGVTLAFWGKFQFYKTQGEDTSLALILGEQSQDLAHWRHELEQEAWSGSLCNNKEMQTLAHLLALTEDRGWRIQHNRGANWRCYPWATSLYGFSVSLKVLKSYATFHLLKSNFLTAKWGKYLAVLLHK